MGPWLKLISKHLIFSFLVLSYAFGSHYNKKYFELMNSLGVAFYDLPHSVNVRGRQPRHSEVSNKHTTEQGVSKRSSYDSSQTTGANNKSCCKSSCTVRRKRSLTFPSKNRLTLGATLRFLSSSSNNTNERTLENNDLFNDHTGRTVRSLSNDVLSSIGGDLIRIQSDVIRKPRKDKKEEVPVHQETGLNTSEDEFIDNLIMQESESLNDKKEKIDNTDILENAFHHSKSKNRHVIHTKRAKINSKIENEKKTVDHGKPNLLSFFKDEGEPVVSVVNQTEDEREEHEDDPFQGTVIKSDGTVRLKQSVHGNFEEYHNKSKPKTFKVVTPTAGVTHAHSAPSKLKENNVNVNTSTNATISPLIKSKTDKPIDFSTGTGISIKSIFANAVEEAVENVEHGEIKDRNRDVIMHRDIVPSQSGDIGVLRVPNLDSVEMFLNDSNNYSPDDERIDQINGQHDQSNSQHDQSKGQHDQSNDQHDQTNDQHEKLNGQHDQMNGQHDKRKNINPESAISEENRTNLKTNNVNLENIPMGDKLKDNGSFITKTLSTLSGSGNKITDKQENDREAIEVPSTNTTDSKSGKMTSLEGTIPHEKTVDSESQNPTNDDEMENNESPTKEKMKESIISPYGEDYIGSDVQPSKTNSLRGKDLLGDEYVETGEYLKSKSILPIDSSLEQEGGLPDEEKTHSILKEKDVLRSNYISEHKDLNKEILELIQSYYKTGGRKHLKDIYRESKWNEANRNRIEFFNVIDKELIGAVCMDGSRPGYYLRKGFDSGSDKWIIHLHGGAWCYNLQTCYKRRNTILGSTKGYSREDISKFFHGILSKNADENPNFFKWNIAVLSYCDGGLFSGNRKMFLMGKGKRFYFRGRRVLRLLMENLRRQQTLHKAEEVILSGTSAGGLALILQGDYIRKFIPKNTKVRGLADAGFFLDQKRSVHGNRMAHKQFKALYELHRPVLKKKCVDSYPKKDRYLCLFPQNTIHFVKLPLFIVNSLYDHWQLSYLEGVNCIYDNRECKTVERDHILNFRNRMYQTLNDVKTFKNNTGVFANSCIAHGQVILDYTWARSKIENVSIADAFFEWYKNSDDVNAKTLNFHADCKYPCNGSCPRSLAQACVENFKGVSGHQRGKSLNLC